MVQAGGCVWLIYELNRRHPLQAAGAAALADTVTVVPHGSRPLCQRIKLQSVRRYCPEPGDR